MAEPVNVAELAQRARRLTAGGRRAVVGIVGPPGSGKSTLAEQVVARLGDLGQVAVLVPMDGFHLAQVQLERLGRAGRKGAPDTFDAAGYAALLGRVVARGPHTVYAPAFRREIEEPIAGAVAVPPDVDVVVTEGNYLLADDERWGAVRGLLTEAWYLQVPAAERHRRLVRRHMAFGRDEAAADAWAREVDGPNGQFVERTRDRADLVIGA